MYIPSALSFLRVSVLQASARCSIDSLDNIFVQDDFWLIPFPLSVDTRTGNEIKHELPLVEKEFNKDNIKVNASNFDQ